MKGMRLTLQWYYIGNIYLLFCVSCMLENVGRIKKKTTKLIDKTDEKKSMEFFLTPPIFTTLILLF